MVEHLQERFDLSQRRACRAIGQPRSSQRYRPQRRDDEVQLSRRMRELVAKYPRFGYRRIGRILRREGWSASNNRMYRLWRREGLKVPPKPKKKQKNGTSANGCQKRRAQYPNDVWCWDFAFDYTENGTQLKWLSIVDEYTRECLVLKVGRSITSEDVLDTLTELFAWRGVPQAIRSDNGPEFVAERIRCWLAQLEIDTLYIEPGSPWQNGYAESFHSKLRDEFLNVEVFENLRDARRLTADWRRDYNEYRPHSSLGYRTPAEFAQECAVSTRATPSFQQHTLSSPLLS